MNGYEKRVVYFDWMEGADKIGNAGFAKVIAQNGQLRLMVNIAGLHKTDTLGGELLLMQGDKDICLDSLYLKEGRCVYSRLYTKDAVEQLGIRWEDAYGICIKMGERRCLKSLWGVQKKHTEANIEEVQEEKTVIQEAEVEEMEAAEIAQDEMINIAGMDDAYEKKNIEPPVSVSTQKIIASNRILDDKWNQLGQVFPHVHPFGDSREYLSIAPKDFIVLTREYQCLANNSFLLHGFYNYHHVILGKIFDGKENAKEPDRFYLGVPGVFYEREKAVALMFGFESFECAKEPAEIGTFGYYMKRVEI